MQDKDLTIAEALGLNEDWNTLTRGRIEKLYQTCDTIHEAGLAVLRDVPLAVRTMIATFVAWMLETAVFWLFGLTFGLELGLADYLVIMVTANLIVAMPVAPSNIGPYEVATAEVVALLGVESSLAAGFAIGSHLLNILWVGASGLAALWLMRLSLEDVFFLRPAEEREAAP